MAVNIYTAFGPRSCPLWQIGKLAQDGYALQPDANGAVVGCMAERQREVLLEQVPEVDQIVGVFGREEIATRNRRSIVDYRTDNSP